MVDPRTLRRIAYALLFSGLCLLLMLYRILPISIEAGGIPAPDLMLCLLIAWVLRRPRWVPTLLIAAVFLTADLIFMRPPGLWAGLVVIAAEYLRHQNHSTSELTFANEMILVSGTILAITVANRVILSVTMVDQLSLVLTVQQFATTLMAYPFVALVSHIVFGVRKLSPTEDALESRL